MLIFAAAPALAEKRVALVMANLPSDVNLYSGVILPVSMPMLGRG